MYAIVEIAGQQFKVEKDQRIFVHRLQENEGDKVNFDRVLLTDDKGKINVGAPAIKGITVSATINRHLKGDKIIVFKKKRRKGYQKQNGHRQLLTELTITGIAGKGGEKEKAKAVSKKTEAKSKEPEAKSSSSKKVTAKPTAKKTTKPAAKPKAKTESKPKVKPQDNKKAEKKEDKKK